MDNKRIYDKKYTEDIPYKYKTNTRYQRYLIQKCEKYIDAESIKKVLDIGCGKGLNTVRFCEDYPEAKITGIDISEEGISWAQAKYHGIENLEFISDNICNYIKSVKQKYDMVCAFELLEHIEDWKKLAITMTKMSRRYILVSSPVGHMRAYEISHGHFRNYKKGELEHYFAKHGFRIVKTYYAGFPFWSPITRDLLQLREGAKKQNGGAIQVRLNSFQRIVSVMLYYLYRYFCSVNIGDQFMGLFEKKEN